MLDHTMSRFVESTKGFCDQKIGRSTRFCLKILLSNVLSVGGSNDKPISRGHAAGGSGSSCASASASASAGASVSAGASAGAGASANASAMLVLVLVLVLVLALVRMLVLC